MFGDGRLVHLPGGVDEYLARASDTARPAAPGPAAESATEAPAGRSAAEVRQARKELAKLERQVGKLEQKEADLLDQLAANATDYAKVADLDAQLKDVRAEREQVEEAWLTLADQLPAG